MEDRGEIVPAGMIGQQGYSMFAIAEVAINFTAATDILLGVTAGRRAAGQNYGRPAAIDVCLPRSAIFE